MKQTLRSRAFWLPFVITFMITVSFFAWELGYFNGVLLSPPRTPASQAEIMYIALLVILLSLNAGLVFWQNRHGSCPVGVKRASSIAGFLGALTLICPACMLLPASLIGVGFFFVFIGPYIP